MGRATWEDEGRLSGQRRCIIKEKTVVIIMEKLVGPCYLARFVVFPTHKLSGLVMESYPTLQSMS